MNWKQEAVERLRKYTAMEQAASNIPIELKRLEAEAVRPGVSAMDHPAVRTSSGRSENWLINNMISRQELARTYENVQSWMTVTDGALSVLPEDERLVLTWMYIHPNYGGLPELCAKLGVEQSSVYRKRDQALYTFTVALYGEAG